MTTWSTKEQITYLNGLNTEMNQILWRHELFRTACYELDPYCLKVLTPEAAHDGVYYISGTSQDQAEPPTRQLHAIEVKTGRLLWKNTDQPVYQEGRKPGPDRVWRWTQYRSDDGAPMVADGKVIIKVTGLLGSVSLIGNNSSYAYRALHAKTGATLWTTEPIPGRFRQKWNQAETQTIGIRIAAGKVLITEVIGGNGDKEFWAYSLSDGRLMWRRSTTRHALLMASSGGVFYVAD